MKAAYIEEKGGFKNIIIGQLLKPTITPKEVLVKVIYTTVNHVDCYIRSGKYAQSTPIPFIIGRDFCGKVVEVGKDCKRFKKGDLIWSHCQGIHGKQGTFAEYLSVEEESLFPLPKDVDPFEAIGVFHSAFTVLLGLDREAQLKKGDILYIHGAAGNIGAMLIQIAIAKGAQVIASTHGEEKMTYCKALGANHVLDYKENLENQIKEIAPHGLDIFWNTSRHHNFKFSLPLLAKRGRYILMAGSGTEAVLPIGDLYTKDASIRGFTITNATADEIKQTAIEMNQLLKDHRIKAKTYRIITLEDAQKAHEWMETQDLWGKIIIKIS